MTNITLKQRFNSTPLTKWRFFGLILIIGAFGLMILAALVELSNDHFFPDDFIPTVFFTLISIILVLVLVDNENRKRWIKHEAKLVTDLSPEYTKNYIKTRFNVYRESLRISILLILVIMNLAVIGTLIRNGNQYLWLPATIIVISTLLFLFLEIRKRLHIKNGKVILSDFGMIYLGDVVMWIDRVNEPCFIDDLKLVDDIVSGSNLYLRVKFVIRGGYQIMDYYVSIPDHPTSDLKELIERIQDINIMYRIHK